MPKILQINSKIWKGSVEIADPLTMPQVRTVEIVIDAQLSERNTASANEKIWTSIADERMLPAICACVIKWNIDGFPDNVTPDNFPATPRKDAHELIKQIFNEIYKIWRGEIEIPNA